MEPSSVMNSFAEPPPKQLAMANLNDSSHSVFVKRRLPPMIYQRATGISGYITMPSAKGRPRVRCTFLILCLFFVILMLNASYSVCAPFLPMEAEKHGIDQSYLGIMF